MTDRGGHRWLSERLAEHGAETFLIHGGETAGYDRLLQCVAEGRARLHREEVLPGATVALIADYSLETIGWLVALIENGNIVVPITPSAEAEIRVRLDEARAEWDLREEGDAGLAPRRLSCDGEPHGFVRSLRDTGHAGLVLFSSGSTGKPKAMIHDLTVLLDSYRSRRRRTRPVTIVAMLLFDHIGGLNTLLSCLVTGATLVVPAQRTPEEVARLVEEHQVKVLPTSPTFLNLMLATESHRNHDLRSLKLITYGTEPMPESLLARLREGFPGAKLVQTFGTSETGIPHTRSKSSSSTLMKIDDPGYEWKIVDGELWLRSETRILGYLNYETDSLTEDGWFRTGDLVQQEPDGFLRILGRATEVINVGGEKVLPAEVESVLLSMPEVADCVVYGRPNAITGNTVAAQVVLSEGVEPEGIKKTIRRYCRSRMVPYKIPTYVQAVEHALFGRRFKKKRPTES